MLLNEKLTIPNAILDINGKPALYVFNYIAGGTVIFSADYRFDPVVFFNKSGSINESDSLPHSFRNTLQVFVNKIEALRYDENKIEPDLYLMQTNQANYEWNVLDNMFEKCCLHPMPYTSLPYNPCDHLNPQPISTTGPLMTSLWDQASPYNNMCSHSPCSTHAFAGCVAVAVSQVVRYTQPNTSMGYNYNSMPDELIGTEPNGDIHRLIADAHRECRILVECDFTFSTNSRAKNVLRDYFNILSAIHDGTVNPNSNIIRDRIINEILNGRPVILGGMHNISSNSHSWVCDGYRFVPSICAAGDKFFHMNWGWGGVANGWVLYNYWSPSDDDERYNTFLNMVYNIHN